MKLNQRRGATTEQINYIQILFNDCGFTQKSKQSLLASDFGVGYIDELDIGQADRLIKYLKDLKSTEGT